ncbi:tungstate transport system ATP-binding protein [Roseinatronobacter thiooxidans]|uniref:Tungstate transport system ATP-binding protein n=1 Tax=Roseinatronobacter thiooxidans TaxID=121821 RepID=A0A2W7QJP4_9RHOB|nr:ATP-binding cassette domain-containing protein [Roseinatronobacter thiooxidans]PZX46170.1 tungstate transport system ATP-binding protein [Roseinatronobacter thiooxidans]
MQSILPLTLEDIEIRRNGKRLLGPVSWVLDGAGISILMGPNGSGKTTFLRAMHGIERISGGRIRWAAQAPEVQQAQAFVFQAPIMMRRTVRDSIAYPLRLRGVSRAQARSAAEEWAARVGLGAALARPAMVLSGGEKQKLALARALVTAPQLLFLDEPCANLDGRATHDIEHILQDACKAGTRVVMSTHDIGQARRLADDVLFLHDGRLLETAPKDQFFTRPATPEGAAFLKGDLLL